MLPSRIAPSTRHPRLSRGAADATLAANPAKKYRPTATRAGAASLLALGGALGAVVACGSAGPAQGEASQTASQAGSACENSPGSCTASLVNAPGPSGAGQLFVTCASTGNGVYTLGLGTAITGPWIAASDPSNPSGAIPYPSGSASIQFNGVDEDNGAFPGGQVLATYVEVCAQSTNVCPMGDGINAQCVTAPVIYQPANTGNVLWHNGVSGATQVWQMNDLTRNSYTDLDPSLNVTDATAWSIVGSADFDEDGTDDLLWHNGASGVTQVWYMNGATRTSLANCDASLNVADSTGWRIASTADFDHDGKPDILWHNGTSGAAQVWYMNGVARHSIGNFDSTLNTADSTGWKIAATADFNDDGDVDILWHDGTSGASQVWYLDGIARIGFANFDASLNTADSTGWTIVGASDFNRDGHADILWHNGGSGATQVWYLNDVTRIGFGSLDASLNVTDSTGWKPKLVVSGAL
jgi:hypothetical protein